MAFADNLTSAWRLSKLGSWWNEHLDVGQKYGYFSKPSKTILIVKPKYVSKAAEIFHNTNIKITSSGQKHFGSVIGSELYWEEYIEEIEIWAIIIIKGHLNTTSRAYSAYIHGFKIK